jgi:hypothetical protein
MADSSGDEKKPSPDDQQKQQQQQQMALNMQYAQQQQAYVLFVIVESYYYCECFSYQQYYAAAAAAAAASYGYYYPYSGAYPGYQASPGATAYATQPQPTAGPPPRPSYSGKRPNRPIPLLIGLHTAVAGQPKTPSGASSSAVRPPPPPASRPSTQKPAYISVASAPSKEYINILRSINN